MIKFTCGASRGICVDCMEARIEELEAELNEIKTSYREILDEPCGSDDRLHCTCVPVLRKELETYRSKVRRLVEAIKAIEPFVPIYGLNEHRDELKQAIEEVEHAKE